MERVYDLTQTRIFRMDPSATEEDRERVIQQQDIDEDAKDRVRGYVAARWRGWGFPRNEAYRFYVFPASDNIELPHHPRLERNFESHTYFTLGDLTSGKQIVQTISQQTKRRE